MASRCTPQICDPHPHSVANFLWPWTRVLYLWNTPTSRGLFITYIYICSYVRICDCLSDNQSSSHFPVFR